MARCLAKDCSCKAEEDSAYCEKHGRGFIVMEKSYSITISGSAEVVEAEIDVIGGEPSEGEQI